MYLELDAISNAGNCTWNYVWQLWLPRTATAERELRPPRGSCPSLCRRGGAHEVHTSSPECRWAATGVGRLSTPSPYGRRSPRFRVGPGGQPWFRRRPHGLERTGRGVHVHVQSTLLSARWGDAVTLCHRNIACRCGAPDARPGRACPSPPRRRRRRLALPPLGSATFAGVAPTVGLRAIEPGT